MCGIFGFARKEGFCAQLDLFKLQGAVMDLALLNESRGSDGTGLGFLTRDKTHLFKEAASAMSLFNTKRFHKFVRLISSKTMLCIGHTRMATVGEPSHLNCHPFVTEDFVGSHNGNFINYRQMLDRYQKKSESDVDSEAIFRVMDGEAKIPEMVSKLGEMEGDFALAFAVRRNPGQILFLRSDERTLHVSYVPKMRTLFWSSQKDHLDYALRRNHLEGKSWKIEKNYLYQADTGEFGEKLNCKKTACPMKGTMAMMNAFHGRPWGSNRQRSQRTLFSVEEMEEMGWLDDWGTQRSGFICGFCSVRSDKSQVFYDETSGKFICEECSFDHDLLTAGETKEDVTSEYCL